MNDSNEIKFQAMVGNISVYLFTAIVFVPDEIFFKINDGQHPIASNAANKITKGNFAKNV